MDESDRAASRWQCTCSDPVWQHVARSDKLRNISRRAVSLNNRRDSVCEQNWVSPESAVSSFCTHSLPVRTSQSSPHGPELAPVRGPPPCTVCSSIRYVITSITESEARPQQAARTATRLNVSHQRVGFTVLFQTSDRRSVTSYLW